MQLEDLREQLRYAYDPYVRNFHQLMAKRIKTILMVSNHYESFILARDSSLTYDIYGTSQLLHLQNVPQITRALSGGDALHILSEETFDLVLVSANLPDMDTFEFGRTVRSKFPTLPIVMLVFDGRWFDKVYAGTEPEGIDWIFAWRGSAIVLLSIIKLVEDVLNLDLDLQKASIGILIVVEDSIEHYSSLLPPLYTILMQRTFLLVPDGINEMERQLRTRLRPKVLLARTFQEATVLFDKYEGNLIGIISDYRIAKEEYINPRAGLDFLQYVGTRSPGTPILVQSADPKAAEIAKSLNVRYLDKRSANIPTALERFVLEDVGFGDFVFRNPDGAEIQRVSNLWEMEQALPLVPDESIVRHVDRNDFSHWFRSRGESTLAGIIRPIATADFETITHMREFLQSAISITRTEKYRGAIADFRGLAFDPNYPFLVSGRGSLGGKGRGLAFMFHLLSRHLKEDQIEGVRIRLPHTLIVAADEFDRFLKDNELHRTELESLDDAHIQERFLRGKLTSALQRDLSEYIERIHFPLAVRSSSLLEDSHYQPFAGLYATYMLPNNHHDKALRLEQLCNALRLVYASVYLSRPMRYFESLGMNPGEEKMAVIIQEVAGQLHGEIYYPTFSGVAQSYNYYPISHMKPDDGVATIALGLGKQVVEGGDAVRFCPRYPQILPQFNSPSGVMKASQRNFFALDLSQKEPDLSQGPASTLAELPLSRAEKDGTLSSIGSVVSLDDDRIYDGVNRAGPRVVTFARVLKAKVFPLSEILNHVLEVCRENLGAALEIEFAVNLADETGQENEFVFLQMRPLVARRERCDIVWESLPAERILCHSHRVMGNGRVENLRDILYIHPDRFDRGKSADVASAVAAMNERLLKENRPYLLIGPGRWGSLDPWIGIPVAWHQISGARVIVETASKDIPLEPSQGTHFFHNMTSAGIGYFSLPSISDTNFVQWGMLDSMPGIDVTPWLRQIRLESPLTVLMDGQTQEGVICL